MLKIIVDKNGYESVMYDSPDSLMYVKEHVLCANADLDIPAHRHEDIEISLATEGSIIYNVCGRAVRVDEGSAVAVNSGRFHTMYCAADIKSRRGIQIMINPAIICTTKELEDRFVVPVIAPDSPDYFLFSKDDPGSGKVLGYIREILSAYRDGKNSLAVARAFFSVWQELYGRISGGTFPPPAAPQGKESGTRRTLKSMLEFIYENYSREISLAEIAAAGNMGRSKCSEIFIKYLHDPPMKFLTNYRLYKSLKLLEETDKSILDIAYETGFATSSYYTETFKKYIGCTPTEYRKTAGKDSVGAQINPKSFALIPPPN